MVNLTNRLPRRARKQPSAADRARGMATGGAARARGMATGGAARARGMATGGAARARGMATGGAARARGMATGGSGASRARSMAPRIGVILAAFSIGALMDRFVFDRQNARRRRHMARERNVAKLKRRARVTAKRARYLEGVAEGMAHKAAHAVHGTNSPKEPADDLTLAQKVESEAFRHAAVSKAHVSVNAEGGTVFLRGRLDSDAEIEKLVKAAQAVEGVKRVESMLHTT
jgi:osmotically-inducible protein OsmY